MMLEKEMVLPSHVGYVMGRYITDLFRIWNTELTPNIIRFLNLLRGCARGGGGVLQEVCRNYIS